jgi:diacylglycerol kinase (ATP)
MERLGTGLNPLVSVIKASGVVRGPAVPREKPADPSESVKSYRVSANHPADLAGLRAAVMLEAFRHVVHATGYSMAGLRFLLRSELAARIEIAVSAAALVWLLIIGASFGEIVVFLILFCILMSVEALNTAIEVIVNRLSPEYSDFAKMAKDLASFAVFGMLAAGAIYVAYVTVTRLGLVAAG